MKAKGKAKQLFHRMCEVSRIVNTVNAKKCALIAVDEIIAEIKLMFPEPYKQQWKYWQQVKDEIINL